jgi:hypothetical protein
MRKLSATRKFTRAVGLVSFFAWLPVSALAQQPANQPPAGGVPAGSGAAGAAIDAEGERKAIVFFFLDNNLFAEPRYYWWRGGCYVRYQPGNYQSVALDACLLNSNRP